MSLRNTFATDKTLEQEGVKVSYADNEDGTKAEFLVARAGGRNLVFEKTQERIYAPHRRQIMGGSIGTEKLKKLNQEIFFRACLKGWKNVQLEPGENLDFTLENFLMLCEELPDLWNDLGNFASDMQSYKRQEIEEDAGN